MNRTLQNQQLARLRVFTTGGTIDKVYFDAKSDFEVGESEVPIALTRALVDFEYEIEAICQKDSLQLTDADRQLIASRVRTANEQHILITHGTDGMVETASYLVEIPEKVIVLTGAMQPSRFHSSEAMFNLGGAITALGLLDAGVYLAMHGRIFHPTATRKNREKCRFEDI